MSLEARPEPIDGAPPAVRWRWDAETDILSGAFGTPRRGGGFTGTVELTDPEGSIVVLDVSDGLLCGIDVVVWPEVATVATLAPPSGYIDGHVALHSKTGRGPVVSLEVDTELEMVTNPTESVFHLRIGDLRRASVVRAAQDVYVEIDAQHHLAGFWLTAVPPLANDDR